MYKFSYFAAFLSIFLLYNHAEAYMLNGQRLGRRISLHPRHHLKCSTVNFNFNSNVKDNPHSKVAFQAIPPFGIFSKFAKFIRMNDFIRKSKIRMANALMIVFFAVNTFLNIKPAIATNTPIKKEDSVQNTNAHKSTSRSSSQKSHSNIQRKVSIEVELVDNNKKSTIGNKQAGKTQTAVETYVNEANREAVLEVESTWRNLAKSLKGAKLNTLILLIATSAIIPLFKKLKTSPIIGFLLTGVILGPGGLHWIQDVHMIDVLGELGIVFFLFEMGLELSLDKLKAMKKDVFGLGTSQFALTTLAISTVAKLCGLSNAAAITIGGSLALSSSAFVLQLLKDKDAMGTRHGKASFGILLLQDLAVVPLIVIVQLLSKGGAGLGKALTVAGVKALVSLSAMSYLGKKLLNPIFYVVAKSSSHEAFLSIILSTVLLMSFVTKGIGLSDTLGAFLAGLLLAETSYHYQIEADIAPFRGLLLGVFFMTVGFSIDLKILLTDAPRIAVLLFSLLAGKALIITGLCKSFGMSLASAQQCGLLNSQGGEFAFVALGIAEKAGLIPTALCRRLLTTVALSMAATPMLFDLGSFISNKIEQNAGGSYKNEDAAELKIDGNVFICGYGRVGKMIGDMLDRKFIKFVAVDKSPKITLDAKNKGLPVFFGDLTRPEVLKSFNVGSCQACVITIDDMKTTNLLLIALRKYYPDIPIIVRAKNAQHSKRLTHMFDNVRVMSPVLPDDSVLLNLPFGGVVLRSIGVSKPEIDALLEDFRKVYMEDKELDDESVDFLDVFKRRLPSSIPEVEDTVRHDIGHHIGSGGGSPEFSSSTDDWDHDDIIASDGERYEVDLLN